MLALVALVANVHSHGVILSAVGDSGESRGFLGTLLDFQVEIGHFKLTLLSQSCDCTQLHHHLALPARLNHHP